MPDTVTALIVDIVDSRKLEDRRAAQHSIREAFNRAQKERPMRRELWPTVGDEFQAIFYGIGDALLATALVRLVLPEDVDCRFGIGRGETTDVDEGESGAILDGSAWWNARKAIEETHKREHGNEPYLRSWFVSDQRDEIGFTSLINSFLLLRDEKISSMGPRERRLTAGIMLGRSQTDLARQEDVTQSAVSQSLRRSGGGALAVSHRRLPKDLQR
ncbi:SatD family protein [Arthrobacter sp. TmT3-37]